MPPSWNLIYDTLDTNYISYDDLLRDARNYTGVMDFPANITANHENASGVSDDPQVQGLVDRKGVVGDETRTPSL